MSSILSSQQKKIGNLIQTTLSFSLLTKDEIVSSPAITVERDEKFVTKWKRWMKVCEEYVERFADLGISPSIGDIQRCMLREIGLSSRTTSLVLRDLAEVGRIQVIKNKVIPCK